MDQKCYQEKWLTIVNPNAGNGRGFKDWNKISSLLSDTGLQFETRFTLAKEHAIALTREALSEGYRKFITVGGDGTLNEVLNGVMTSEDCDPASTCLGLIPVGTGNDWCRMFGIPTSYAKAIQILKEGKQMLHDVGEIRFFEGDEERTRYFLNTAGLGFESVVVKRTNSQKEKGHSGKTIYFYSLLMGLLSYKNTKSEIIIDGESKTANIFSVNVGNGKYCGGGMRQTPNAVPDDGLLDVTVINGVGKLEIVRSLNMLYNGKILNHPKIDGYRCRSLQVNPEQCLWIEADGESLGHTPAGFSIIPSAVNIVYGTRLIP
jgi:diacylglycerol kinase (ATP)